jgi:molecular chaperone DnaK (HSP70)
MRTSVVQRGQPVAIVPNGEGRRFTHSVVAILPISESAPPILTDEDVSLFKRSVGDLAIAHRHPGNSTCFLPLLLGKNYSTKLVAFFQRRNLTLPFDADEDDYLETLAPPKFFAAQLISAALTDMKRLHTKNLTLDELALVVPKFLTHHQRSAYVRSAKLATYNPRLVETMCGVGYLFAIERNQLFKGLSSMMVAFVDIGASQMQVSIQEFKATGSNEVQILEIGYAWTDQVGSYSVDASLARVIRREILKRKPDAEFTDKSIQRIIAAARRIKHELTLQPEVSLFLEDLVHGFDMTFTYSLERLKKLCRRELAAINRTFFEAFHGALLSDPDDIDRFELVGGGSRSPLFADAINATFSGRVPVCRSLNAEEAAVIGAGYKLASARKGFLTTLITFTGFDLYNITIDTGKHTTFCYAPKGQLPLGIPHYIRTVDMGQRGQYQVVDGRVRVRGCRKLSRSGLHKEKRVSVERLLHAFEMKEKEAAEKEKRFHEFESFLLDARDNVTKDPMLLEVSSSEERMKALRIIANAQYVLEKNRDIDDEEFERMKNEVNQTTQALLKRAQERRDAPAAHKRLKELLVKVTQAVENDWPRMGMKPKTRLLRNLGKVCSRTEKWLNEHTDFQEVTASDIQLMYERLRGAFEHVKNNLKKAKHSASDL